MYNLTILLRKANATKECGSDVRELRCCGGFGKLCIPLEKSWLRPCTKIGFIYMEIKTHFHMKGCAPILVLIGRQEAIWK